MKIVMVSNYINHHQIPFCESLYRYDGVEFIFVQTEKMAQSRLDMGWGDNIADLPYVICSYDDEEAALKRIDESDLLLAGWMEDESLIKNRLKSNKPTFRISERIYREGQWKAISPKGLIRKYKEHIRYRKAPVYLLCCGAYVASDFNLIKAYPDKMYKFGYFPRFIEYDNLEELWNKKDKLEIIEPDNCEELQARLPVLTDKEIQIVWAGRFMELKHPEYMIHLASDLSALGYRFHIHMAGSGNMEEQLKRMAEYEMVREHITFYGFLTPDKIRELMERCHIHIFTSNFLEGWGAVVNEGMNGGCAEVVSDEAGCGHFLIEHEKNGLLYSGGKYENMLKEVIRLFENPLLISKYGEAAYKTIATRWNEREAAKRVVEFYKSINKENKEQIPLNGPMSKAPIIKPKFFDRGKLEE